MQIPSGRAGLGPVPEAETHTLILRATRSLWAPSTWLSRTPAAPRTNGGGGPWGHSPPSPPCSCSCWCSRASVTCCSPPREGTRADVSVVCTTPGRPSVFQSWHHALQERAACSIHPVVLGSRLHLLARTQLPRTRVTSPTWGRTAGQAMGEDRSPPKRAC